jgi:hypothetical protein
VPTPSCAATSATPPRRSEGSARATQEIGLNEALEAAGIHRRRAEIREIFLREVPGVDPELTSEPRLLAMAARKHLRERFLRAKVARRRERGQRPDVPAPARHADHRDGHREGRAHLGRPPASA